jgi:hypothetical protein
VNSPPVHPSRINVKDTGKTMVNKSCIEPAGFRAGSRFPRPVPDGESITEPGYALGSIKCKIFSPPVRSLTRGTKTQRNLDEFMIFSVAL